MSSILLDTRIIRANKQICSEALAILHSENEFKFNLHHTNRVSTFVSALMSKLVVGGECKEEEKGLRLLAARLLEHDGGIKSLEAEMIVVEREWEKEVDLSSFCLSSESASTCKGE
jgi:hypothetical protein